MVGEPRYAIFVDGHDKKQQFEFQILEHQVAMENGKSNIFINIAHEALAKNKMEPVDSLMKHPKTKGKKENDSKIL